MRRLLCTAMLLILGAGPLASTAAAAGPWEGRTVLVTGANRGLGLEFVRQLRAAGATVIGTARNPEDASELAALGARVEQLDVTDPESVAALAARLGSTALDALFNNAGWFGCRDGFTECDPDVALREYEVNCLGPLRVTQVLVPALRAGDLKLVMNMSSGLGSIANNGRGTSVGYRASKAALNMVTATIAAELADEGFVCVSLSPGWVRTDMGGPNANLSPEESVAGMLGVLAGLERSDNGRFYAHDGAELPW
jgi:NAD(P)-dependent dehydrogenase (short-subunit alcohol dehydrogenase family)